MKNQKKLFRPAATRIVGIVAIILVIAAAFILPVYAPVNSDTNSDSPLSGDLNGDGVVNILDFILLKMIMMGQAPPTDFADVDGNGIINALDLTAMLDKIFGKAASSGGGGGGGGGGSSVTNQVNFELSTYMSSYGPGTTGETFTARIRIAQTSYLYNGSFTVDYDPLILQVNDVNDGLFSTACVINMTNGVDWTDTPGQLTVSPNLSSCAVDGTGVSGNGYLCDIVFETRGAGTSPLTLGNGTLYRSQSGNLSAIAGTRWINSSAQISQKYSLTTASSDHGNVTTPGEAGPYAYNAGQVVSIIATPETCCHFVNWTGDTGTIANPNAASTTITMNGDYSIQANFAINTYSLSVTANNSGGAPSFDGSSPFDCGTSAAIHANTNSCYTFSSWSPADGVANRYAEDTTVTMTQNRTLTANYIQKQYTLTMNSGGNGSTTPSTGTHTYGCGTIVNVSAQANTCYIFSQWTGTAVSAGKVANPNMSSTTVTVDGNYSLQANFVTSDTFTLALVADPTAGGAPYFDGSSPFDCGVLVNIYANTDPCYTFVNWTGSTTITSPTSANTTVRMNSSYTLTAHYSIRTYSLTTNVLPAEAAAAGCTVTGGGIHNCGVNAPVQANGAGIWTFDQWSGHLSGNTSPTSILMDGNKSVTANFIINPNTVYFQNVSNQTVGNNFSIQVMIYNTSYLTYGTFDIRYNSSILSFVSLTNISSAIGDGTGTTTANIKSSELFTIDVDYSSYANSHSGNGVSGSGYLCTLTFSPIAPGTSPLYFVAGEGSPPGELSLIKWINYEDSAITPVYWITGSVTVQ